MPEPEQKPEDPTKGRKLFIGGLSWDTNDTQLQEYFKAFGELEDAMVVYNRAAGVSRGFGFVTFKRVEDAETCLQHPHKVNNKTVEAKPAVHKGEQGRVIETLEQKMAKQVFVGGLPPNTTSDQLKEWAQIQWGAEKVRNAIAVLDLETKVTRGFGFVNFTDPSMVPMAISGVNGREYFIGDKKVEVKRAQMRDRSQQFQGRGYHGGGRGRGGRGRGRGSRGGQQNGQFGGNYQQGFNYGQQPQYGTQYGTPGQFDMSVYSQYPAAPGGYMGYPQPQSQPQAYGNPAQMAMYSGMAQTPYGQPPASGPKASPGQGKGVSGVMGAGGMQGSAPLQQQDVTTETMRSFEQMSLGGPAGQQQAQMPLSGQQMSGQQMAQAMGQQMGQPMAPAPMGHHMGAGMQSYAQYSTFDK